MNEKFDIGRLPLNYITELGLVPLASDSLVVLSDGNASEKRRQRLEFLVGQPVEIRTLDTVDPEICRAYLYIIKEFSRIIQEWKTIYSWEEHVANTIRAIDEITEDLRRNFPDVI